MTPITRTDYSFGGPLPHQLANLPQTHPKATSDLGYGTFQYPYPIRYYPQFPKVIPVRRLDYPRVTEPFADIAI